MGALPKVHDMMFPYEHYMNRIGSLLGELDSVRASLSEDLGWHDSSEARAECRKHIWHLGTCVLQQQLVLWEAFSLSPPPLLKHLATIPDGFRPPLSNLDDPIVEFKKLLDATQPWQEKRLDPTRGHILDKKRREDLNELKWMISFFQNQSIALLPRTEGKADVPELTPDEKRTLLEALAIGPGKERSKKSE